jgi:pyrimidine deaminase RibD-like protein
MAGTTDYTGVSMDAILSHVRGWRDSTANTIKALQRLRGQVETHKDRLDWPAEILNFLDCFIDLFGRYLGDFERLASELPRNVSDAHIQIVRQIYNSSSLEERLCVNFKKEHIERSLKDESLRGLVDRVYAESRDTLIDYRDLSNLEPRLRTFIGTASGLAVDSDADRRFALMAIEEARKSVPEDGRVHPKVGAVVVKNGVVLSKAHRGEKLKCHAEYIALENKLPDDLIAGATVYTTLEPCTTRKHPKVPCAQRLIESKGNPCCHWNA